MFSTILTLIGGIKGLAVIALIIAVGSWAFVQTNKVRKAELARDEAIVQRDQTALQRDKAIEVSRVNEATISRLEQEKMLVNQALNTLQQARDTNRTNTVTREVIIQSQAGVPENAAVTAPVLGSIVVEVQADRQRRRPMAAPAAAAVPSSPATQRIRE